MNMNQMMMARHHAEMYMLDMQAAQAYQTLSNICMAKAQGNYRMYAAMTGSGDMMQQMPGMGGGAMLPGAGTPGMMGGLGIGDDLTTSPGMYDTQGYGPGFGIGTGTGMGPGGTETGR